VVRQQQARGAREQLRTQIRGLINNELLLQEANRNGVAKKAEVQQQIELTRQEVIANAVVAEYIRAHPVGDGDVQKEYERAKSQTGEEYRSARPRGHR
jgi:peptidyl-prolyl cis-trans isomerase C